MKMNLSHKTRRQGTALIVTLTVVTVSAMMLGSYLLMVQTQTASVARSQTWNAIIPVTEAGIEDGLAMINSSSTANVLDPTGMTWTNGVGNGGPEGWSALGATAPGITTVSRNIGSNGYSYIATIDVSQVGGGNGEGPIVTATGLVPFSPIPWVFSKNGSWLNRNSTRPYFFAAAGADSFAGTATSNVGRVIQVRTKLIGLFSVGIACRTNFNMNGKLCRVDSFDSSTNTYSSYFTNSVTGTNGVWIYDANKAKSGGDVGVNAAVAGSVSLGNGTIYGHLSTGPGSVETQVQMGPHGTVGEIAWAASHDGIENDGTPTSWWSPTFNVTLPSLPAPTFTGTGLPSQTTTGAYSGYIVIPQAGISNYVVAALPSTPLYIVGKASVWVKGSASVAVTIATTNKAQLDLYVGNTIGSGDSISLAGSSTSTLNQPGYARNLRIFGLPSCTTINMNGNAGWTACVYAPDADVSGGGGGNNVQDTGGALVCRSLSLRGHWNFHYDESLKSDGSVRGWVGKTWTELPYTNSTSLP
ncbi:MAG: hypothetical protein JWR69_3280 [Pedosphaera sp.]|nr:hypothetical protein [Pedosphaera sp.]